MKDAVSQDKNPLGGGGGGKSFHKSPYKSSVIFENSKKKFLSE